ncbi:unnamed protein product, partial [Allacma fusca]
MKVGSSESGSRITMKIILAFLMISVFAC